MPLTIWSYVSSYKKSGTGTVKGKIGFYFPEITLTAEFPGSNFLLPTFSIGSKQDFQMANLSLATVNFEPWLYCRARIDHRIKQLTEGLMSELQVSPERSLRGGPRAARRAVAQLIRLGKSAQVCTYFIRPYCFLARLDKVQEELLYYPRCRR